MPKARAARTVYRCQECGGTAPKWVGRCPSCEAWGTLVEEREAPSAVGANVPPAMSRPMPIGEVDMAQWRPQLTGIGELDRVLGGGLVPGSVTLLGGEPGIGKSTLLLQAVSSIAADGATVLYVSAEESTQQVRVRADRLGTLSPSLYLVSESALPHLLAAVDEVRPEVLVVDSIQTVFDPDLGSAPGSVSQVRECAARLVGEAKSRGLATILVGHVTKDGGLAGPRVLEHVVDTVLAFEGERHHALRLLRASKHRFGATDQLGLFEMTGGGLEGVPDPSRLFLADRRHGVSGSVVVPTMEGHRPLLAELQALVTRSSLASPRRSTHGLDSGRAALLLAVLAERAGLSFDGVDVYALAVGGVRITEPGADLALALALASALVGRPVPADLVVCGEVGLGGEVRQVAQCERRLAEAARLGFARAVVPRSSPGDDVDIELLRVDSLAHAIDLVGLAPGSTASVEAPAPRLRAVAAHDLPDHVPDDLLGSTSWDETT